MEAFISLLVDIQKLDLIIKDRQGFLEKSNVQMITELVNLITAQRAYETNSRAIRAGDEMLRQANQIARF